MAFGEGPVPGVSVVMMTPESSFLAPGSAAALAMYASPAFFSAAATTAARCVRSSWILPMYSLGSAWCGRLSAASVSPAFTRSTSAGDSANGVSWLASATPSA